MFGIFRKKKECNHIPLVGNNKTLCWNCGEIIIEKEDAPMLKLVCDRCKDKQKAYMKKFVKQVKEGGKLDETYSTEPCEDR